MIVKESKRDVFNELHTLALQSNKLFMVEIDVTNICNCKCPFCFQGNIHQDSEKILNFEEIVELLDQLKELGCYYISFSGGEPFCRKDFISILKEAKKRGFYVTFVSHLQLASDEDVAEINKLGIERVLVSFHSPTPKMYAKIFNVIEKNLGYGKIIVRDNSIRKKGGRFNKEIFHWRVNQKAPIGTETDTGTAW